MNAFLYVLTFITFGAFAQTPSTGKLTGTVADSTTRQPISYVTIAVSTSAVSTSATGARKILLGGTADDKGAFVLDNIPAGVYQITLSFVGYRTRIIPNVAIVPANGPVDLGTVLLAPDTKSLNEVVVTARKALVEDKGDKLVYNADVDATNTGGTAVDVLRKVPMLTVDLEGNVKMRGSSNIRVLVNGKPSSIMARNLADALKQMPANIIKSVEVITSPGAKYDAEGSAGVINIITKKQLQGTNGTINATVGNFNNSLGGNVSVKQGKVGLSASGNVYTYRNIMEMGQSRTTLVDGQPVSELSQRSTADNTGMGGHSELSLDYDPDSLNRLNFSVNAWGGNFPNNSQLGSRLVSTSGQVIQDFRRDIAFRNPYGNAEFNLGWTRSFTKPGKEFSVLSQYSYMPDNYYYTINQFDRASERPTFLEQTTNLSRNNEFTFQSDFANPYKLRDSANLKVEFGAKTIQRFIGSESTTNLSLTGLEQDYAFDTARSNEFKYIQRVFAGYSSLKFDTKNKWALSAGLRLEHTRIDGDFITQRFQFNSQYTNLVPSFTVAKKVAKKHTFKLAYNQRISRPLIWYLNPFRNVSDPRNIQTGNPFLRPELTHATEVSYSTFGENGFSLNTSLFWRQTNNAIEWLSTVDAAGVAVTSPQNIGRNASYGANLSLSMQPNKRIDLSLNTDLTYVMLSSVALGQRNSGWVMGVGPNLTYKLPKDVSVQVMGQYNTGWISLQSTNTGWYFYGLSGKKEFWNKKASLTLNVTNPFNRWNLMRGESSAPSFDASNQFRLVNRSARLTFSYRFGQMSSGGKQSRKISNDDGKGGGR